MTIASLPSKGRATPTLELVDDIPLSECLEFPDKFDLQKENSDTVSLLLG